VPRTHAHLLTAIWSNPDWVALSQGAQRTYVLLLSQQKLTMVGLLDYLPSRWARLAADTTLASVEGHIDELEASRFVLVDPGSDELLIRTFVRHEVSPSKVANPRWLAGLWGAWEGIASRQLRADAITEIPASVWDSPKVEPPAEALQMRRSAQKLLLETSARTNGQNVPHEPLTTPVETKQLVPLHDAGASRAAAVDNSVFDQALNLLTDREIERNPSHTSPGRHRAATLNGKRRDHAPRAHQLLHEHPGLTPSALADLLEPTPAAPKPPELHPALPPLHVADLDADRFRPPPPELLAAARRAARQPIAQEEPA